MNSFTGTEQTTWSRSRTVTRPSSVISPISSDSCHDMRKEILVSRFVERAKAQRIENGYRSGAHGENVANNSAHARSGPLIWFDGAWMIVGFNLEHSRQAMTNVDRARIFPRSLQHPGRLCRQIPQMRARMLVSAVFAPHGAKHSQLHECWFAPKECED